MEHADPVHLRPDRDRLILFDSRNLGITHEEAGALVGLFNGHFAADGMRLQAPDLGNQTHERHGLSRTCAHRR